MVIYRIHPVNPQQRHLEAAAAVLRKGDCIAVYPTDTVYGMGACITNPRALERISALLHRDKTRLFSFLCCDFAQVAEYAVMSNAHFRLMKRYLPGPYTFILPATNFVPKKISPRRKTVGVRIPDYPAVRRLVELLDEPVANTSINIEERLRGNPDEVRSAVSREADVMLDAGRLPEPVGSTIVDLTGGMPVVIRKGKGSWE
jgi:tRNA threonylcarbamoyl adenosine modification protein (Sua5/YciO/YrdC/YwlC family)